jgi:hypothetical protein
MDNHLKAVRAQDIQSGLSLINSGMANLHMKNVKLIGATSQVCSLISPFQVVDGYENLIVAAGELGIDENLLEKSLTELQEIEFIRVIKNGEIIRKIEITIPQLKNRYDIIGKRLDELNPTDIEKASLEILDDLAEMPIKCFEIINKAGINIEETRIIRDIGVGAGFIEKYNSPVDSQEIWYSPIYWDENPEKIIELAEKYTTNDVLCAIKSVRDNQGKPIEKISDPILIEAIANGCLPVPEVSSTAGKKQFLFTPIKGIKTYEKNLLDKARAIVACMRYGEIYGNITKIKYPRAFLESWLNKGYINPHSEIPTQYSILVKLGVGFPDKVPNINRYYFRLIKTDENIRALEIAIQMITLGTINKQCEEEQEAKTMLLSGVYKNPSFTRIKMKNEVEYSTENVILINDVLRGVSSELAF